MIFTCFYHIISWKKNKLNAPGYIFYDAKYRGEKVRKDQLFRLNNESVVQLTKKEGNIAHRIGLMFGVGNGFIAIHIFGQYPAFEQSIIV